MKFLEDAFREKAILLYDRFKAEIILITISALLLIVSMAIFLKSNSYQTDNKIEFNQKDSKIEGADKVERKIFVDISGSIENPDVYELDENARLRDLLNKANGLSDDADRIFFSRNFNLARILVDQEKIYIPSKTEVAQGQLATVKGQVAGVSKSETTSQSNLINLNTTTAKELDRLPGVGTVTADKIIAGRPYSSVEELLKRKIVGKSAYEKIKDLVTIF